ncbi:HNH endonuclease signature motif containing protein [Streptomyces sp. NPDC057620]|uniref:HNH endonuclease signature motif containing protein n=1 Tax=Streptomyces sp. NPDC057620 TaxID=3346185 RepID=UPI0036BC06FC
MSSAAEKFWSKVNGGDVETCWIWTGATNGVRYGSFTGGSGRQVLAHRWAYEALRAEIPAGLSLDHLCRNPTCVNPWHLEPVTQRINLLRGETITARKAAQTHCESGHPFDSANTYRSPNGTRKCRACGAARARRYRATHKLAAQPQSA